MGETSTPVVQDVVTTADNSVLVAGDVIVWALEHHMAIWRLSAAGVPDASWGTGGLADLDVGDPASLANAAPPLAGGSSTRRRLQPSLVGAPTHHRHRGHRLRRSGRELWHRRVHPLPVAAQLGVRCRPRVHRLSRALPRRRRRRGHRRRVHQGHRGTRRRLLPDGLHGHDGFARHHLAHPTRDRQVCGPWTPDPAFGSAGIVQLYRQDLNYSTPLDARIVGGQLLVAAMLSDQFNQDDYQVVALNASTGAADPAYDGDGLAAITPPGR